VDGLEVELLSSECIPDCCEWPIVGDRCIIGSAGGRLWKFIMQELTCDQWKGVLGVEIVDSMRALLLELLRRYNRCCEERPSIGGGGCGTSRCEPKNKMLPEDVYDIFKILPPLVIKVMIAIRARRIAAQLHLNPMCTKLILLRPMVTGWYNGYSDRQINWVEPKGSWMPSNFGQIAFQPLMTGLFPNTTVTVAVEDMDGLTSNSWQIGRWNRANERYTYCMIKHAGQTENTLPVLIWANWSLEVWCGRDTEGEWRRHHDTDENLLFCTPILSCHKTFCCRFPTQGGGSFI